MNIVGPLVKRLAWRERHFFSSFHLHDNGAFQHVNKPMCGPGHMKVDTFGKPDLLTFLAMK
jgi:hypothetical protein